MGSLLLLLGLWEYLPDSGRISRIIVASPSMIIEALVGSAPVFAHALVVTLSEIVLAFALACLVGITAGLLVGSVRFAGDVLVPLLEASFAVPWIIVYPLLVAWFGIGTESKVMFGFLHGMLPIVLTTIAAVRSLDRGYVLLCRSLGASRRDTLLKVLAPAALPGLLAGVRVGLALTIISVLVGEVLTSTDGLGFLISTNQTLFETGHVYLGVALAFGLAVLGNRAIAAVEKSWGSAHAARTIRGASAGTAA